MKSLLAATALTLILSTAAFAQDAGGQASSPNTASQPGTDDATVPPTSGDGSSEPASQPATPVAADPDPVHWVCMQNADGTGTWTVVDTSSGQTLVSPQTSAEPCDPEATDDVVPPSYQPGPSWAPADSSYDGGDVEIIPPPLPLAPIGQPGTSTGTTGIRKLIQGPARTIIYINPNGSILVRGLPGTTLSLPDGVWVRNPDGSYVPVVTTPPNGNGLRIIHTPKGKTVGISPDGHVTPVPSTDPRGLPLDVAKPLKPSTATGPKPTDTPHVPSTGNAVKTDTPHATVPSQTVEPPTTAVPSTSSTMQSATPRITPLDHPATDAVAVTSTKTFTVADHDSSAVPTKLGSSSSQMQGVSKPVDTPKTTTSSTTGSAAPHVATTDHPVAAPNGKVVVPAGTTASVTMHNVTTTTTITSPATNHTSMASPTHVASSSTDRHGTLHPVTPAKVQPISRTVTASTRMSAMRTSNTVHMPGTHLPTSGMPTMRAPRPPASAICSRWSCTAPRSACRGWRASPARG